MSAARAQRLRAELKARGWNARAVSVRSDRCTTDSSLYVTIRRADVRKSEVETVARQFEQFSRDEMTGEILLGGNTYVRVEYDDELMRELSGPLAARLHDLPRDAELEHEGWTIQHGPERGYFRAWDESGAERAYCYHADFAARRVTELLIEAERLAEVA